MFNLIKFVVLFIIFSFLSTHATKWAGVQELTVLKSTVVALPHMGLGIILYHYIFRRFKRSG